MSFVTQRTSEFVPSPVIATKIALCAGAIRDGLCKSKNTNAISKHTVKLQCCDLHKHNVPQTHHSSHLSAAVSFWGHGITNKLCNFGVGTETSLVPNKIG